MRISVNNLGSVGLVKDLFSHDTPPEAWTALQNARMGPYGAESFLGHERSIGTGSAGWAVAPYWLFHAPVTGATDFWVGAGANKVYCRSAQTPYAETNITRQSGGVDVNYAATETEKWNGGMFGGLGVFNNGVDEPQVWNPVASATKLVNLSTTATGGDAWPSNYRARCVRPYGRFLVAVNVLKNTTRYPKLVKWSHPADPGAMPTSWDPANAAKDAGEYPLNDAVGDLVDQLTLRNSNILYTNSDVWSMTWVGGGDIFRFDPLFREQGILYTNCVASFKKDSEFHAMLAGDDLVVHNGQSAESIVTPSMRRWFFQQIEANYYERCFVVANPTFSELWFCIPEVGAEQPTLALVWNWETRSIGFRDLLKLTSNGDTRGTGGTSGTPCIAVGYLDDVSTESWDSDSGSWDSDTTLWDARTTSPAVRRLLMLDRSAGKRTYLVDQGTSFDTAAYSWVLERIGLSAIGEGRDGKPTIDSRLIKLVTEIWPRVEAVDGTQLSIYVGTQDRPTDPVSWSSAYTFTVGTDQFVPVYHSGRYISLRFEYTGTVYARLLAYELETYAQGEF